MNDRAKSPSGVNLDEIERHIRQASTLPPAGANAEDPLAELARIVSGAPVQRREAPRIEPQSVPEFPRPSIRAMSEAVSSQRMTTPPPRVAAAPGPDFQAPPAAAKPPHFASIEDDIERLLKRESAPARRRQDDLEDAMRSLDSLLKARGPAANDPPPDLADWSLRGPNPSAATEHHPQQFDFDAELQRSREASGGIPAEPPRPAPSGRQGDAAWADEPAFSEPPPVPSRRSRRPLIMVTAVLGVAALGVGGALSMRGGGKFNGGAPPLIVADKGPAKIAPVNPGGVEVPDQNRQILERTQPATKPAPKVVNSEEQPIDLREAVRREAAAQSFTPQAEAPKTVASIPVSPPASAPPANPTLSSASTPQPTGGSAPASGPISAADLAAGLANEPKRVRTVAIKPPEPGSTQVQPAAPLPPPVVTPPPAAPSIPPPVAEQKPGPPPSAPVATPPAAAVQTQPAAPLPPPKPKVQGSIASSREAAAASRPTPAKPLAKPPESIDEAAGGPMQITPPARAQRPQPPVRVASAPPVEAAPPTDTDPPVSPGSFVVQLTSEGSDGEARSAISRLQGRYSELGAFSSSVQRREVAGKMRYRVRFGSMSRESAAQLCASLKGKGQDCILQPN